MADDPPSWLGRIGASLRRDVAVADLGRAQAGAAGYEAIAAADELRAELAAAGIDAWIASPSETSQLLCAWNAFALQSLADAFIDTDAGTGAARGFVARVTADQVQVLLREVPLWAGRARRAAADPGYDVAVEVSLPAPFPPWVRVEPCPRSHLAAMVAGGRAMLDRLAAALADLRRGATGDHRGQVQRLDGLFADLETRLASVALPPARSAPAAHEAIEWQLRDGVARSYHVGQVLARPLLAAAPYPSPAARYPSPAAPYPYDTRRQGEHHGHGGHHD